MKKRFWICGAIGLLALLVDVWSRITSINRYITFEINGLQTIAYTIARPLFFLCLGLLLSMALSQNLKAPGFQHVFLWLGGILVILCFGMSALYLAGVVFPGVLFHLYFFLVSKPVIFLLPGCVLGIGLSGVPGKQSGYADV